MPQVQLKRFEQILADILGRVVARSDLSDVSDTSQFKTLAAGVARELDEAYFQFTRLRDLFDIQKAAGEDLDDRAAEIQPGTIQRIQARRAIGTVVFGRTLTVGTVTIPAGTVVKTGDNKVFTTTLQAQILDTQNNSVPVSVTAQEPGSDGNVPAGTIVKFGSKPSGVDTVTNSAPTSQGRDQESDDSFRRRLLKLHRQPQPMHSRSSGVPHDGRGGPGLPQGCPVSRRSWRTSSTEATSRSTSTMGRVRLRNSERRS